MKRRPKPAHIADVIDGEQLRAQLNAVMQDHFGDPAAQRKRALELLHGALFRGRMIAKERLEAGENGLAVARLLAKVADEVVRALYDFTTVHVFPARNPTAGERLALVAVGGYGRGELAPSSDIDLLFLRPYKETAFAESVIEFMLYMLWDMGLKVGHASRTVEDCIKLARKDYTIETALLESRLITGDRKLYEELQKRFRDEIVKHDHTAFIAAKLKERDARHLRAGASRYMVEPNIKEGKGGLRDLHTLFWIAKHRYGYSKSRHYIEAGVFSADEWSGFIRSLEFLWTVRCHLHFITGRAEEKLTFDLQPELAKRMGYGARKSQNAVERFMRRYFLVAKQVGALTRILCAKLEADHAKRAPWGIERFLPMAKPVRAAALPSGFRIEAGRLDVEKPQVLDEPVNLIRLFAIADARDLDVHPTALRETARRLKRITTEVRDDPAARAAFLDVAASPRNPAAALRLMNEAGVLERFVPEFGAIVARMQFNMYHHFTVDEHTLQAIACISDIERGRYQKQHPLSTSIFSKIVNRRALYLAMLLHDTGKGVGDQQVEGAKNARAVCERLGLPEEEVELVEWLVGHHLEMSDVAQKRDIGDPRTVSQFAARVETLERLRLLLVLTVADIRAVGPTVWNDWKGQLLRDLYRLTEAAFHGGRSDEQGVRERLAELATEAKEKLVADLGADSAALAPWLGTLEDGYWLSNDADALAWHAREVLAAKRGEFMPHVAARPRPEQGVTELLVYAQDRPGLFASLAAAISSAGADIADARVNTTKEGVAFDVFSVQSVEGKPFGIEDRAALNGLIQRLRGAALIDHPLPAKRETSRRAAAFSIEPWVRIDNDLTPGASVIEASGRDRPGLLAELAHVIAAAGASIVSAHILTHGERASDVFYVQAPRGGPLAQPEIMETIRAGLEAVLRAHEPAAPADPAKQPLAVEKASTAL